jgi:hypothetical protein
MNTSKAMTVLVGGAASAAAVGLTVGLAVAAAAPAASGATLSLCPDFGKANYYRVTISGVFFMSQADAAGYLIHLDDNPGKPGGMTYYLQADDGNGHEGDESLLYQFVPHATTDSAGYLKAVPAGLEYRSELSLWDPRLDEDSNQFDWPEEQDEIYAAAKFTEADGGPRTQFSQKIVKEFSADHVCDGCCS